MKSLLRGQRSDNGENQTPTILSAGDSTDDDHHDVDEHVATNDDHDVDDHDGTDDDHDHDHDDLLSIIFCVCIMMIRLVLWSFIS